MKERKTEISHVDEWGLDVNGGGKWVLVCLEHANIIQDTNKQRLMGHKNHPETWCEMCAEEKGTK